MEETIRSWIDGAAGINPGFLFCLLLAGAFLEYVFPPFPGDLCAAAGAVLAARGQSFWLVFAGVNLGGLLGFSVDYAFGRWLSGPHRDFRQWGPRWKSLASGMDRAAAGLARRTAFYLTVNRFLPGVRAFFFIAAGYARVPLGKVLCFGLLSSVAWNLLLFGAGFLAGKNLDRLVAWIARYTWAAWGVLIVAVVIFAVRWWRGRKRRSAEEKQSTPM